MPEGHLVHRTAREQAADLAGCRVHVSSPQGRLDTEALDGRVLSEVSAHGKHLLHRFEHGRTVHVHLGMRGLWLRYPDPAPPPRKGVRLRLAGRATYDLIAPTTCEVLTDRGVRELSGRLGPDPLRADSSAGEAVARLRASAAPVGAALLDQSVWSGVGNAWRAELLWLARLDPRTPAAELSEADVHRLWELARDFMTMGRDAGQVVSDAAAGDERWVYKRERCRSCGAPIRVEQLGGRTSYACPVEQR